MTTVADAYSRTGAAWQAGPGLVYDRLADAALERCPVSLLGAQVLDLGAGTGAATRAAQRCGAVVSALDAALGMLRVGAATRPPAAVGDALALPFRVRAFDAVIAAFSLNHLVDPAAAMREAVRVLRRGGALVATAYAHDDAHPVKDAVNAAAVVSGWAEEPWSVRIRSDAVPKLATVDRAVAVARDAGLRDACVDHVRVPFPDLTPAQLVAWRMGMANLAPYVATLSPAEQDALAIDALDRLGAHPPVLVRSVIVVTFVRG